MKRIELTQGHVALVDDADFERISQFKWRALIDQRRNRVYAVRRTHGSHSTRKSVYMHREILGISDPRIKVDHSNGSGLDNQRSNLSICTTSQNGMNTIKRDGLSSRYKGVSWNKRYRKFYAAIKLNGRSKHLGSFTDERQAALAYDAAAREHFGDFAVCNFIPKFPC